MAYANRRWAVLPRIRIRARTLISPIVTDSVGARTLISPIGTDQLPAHENFDLSNWHGSVPTRFWFVQLARIPRGKIFTEHGLLRGFLSFLPTTANCMICIKMLGKILASFIIIVWFLRVLKLRYSFVMHFVMFHVMFQANLWIKKTFKENSARIFYIFFPNYVFYNVCPPPTTPPPHMPIHWGEFESIFCLLPLYMLL